MKIGFSFWGFLGPGITDTSPGSVSLLFPVADDAIGQADPAALAAEDRPLPLVYIGNQYDRDTAFTTYFAPTAAHVVHRVAGKWTDIARWPHVNFTGRIPFTDVAPMYRSSLATVLLTPDRYARSGQFTQRLFEAVLAGCLPFAPARLRAANRVVPHELIVAGTSDLLTALTRLTRITGSGAHADLIAQCVKRLDPFRLSRQIRTITAVLSDESIPPPLLYGDRV